ncbi:MAG TPA: glycosyltransferase [Gemmatimonadales bacterium]|jgi:glycosyltransferase involved in cell wall biosynthesis|nr:glycosyltransferase [Gemmatimonadales bacterium]
MHVVVASHHRLPVEGYGGPQRVVVALVRGLAAHGHRVTVLAQPGTKVAEAAKIVEVAPRILKDPGGDLSKFVPEGADILHAHFPMKTGPKGVPFVQTLHGNWKPNTPLPPNTIFLSRDHAKRHGSSVFVYNGLDPAEYIFRRRKEQWDLFLGKLHSDRGYHWAVEAAKRTGRRLIIAGGWRPSFTGSVKYVGEVGGKRTAVLLARARCLWMPAQWDEPFGLPTIEALFSGTPVLGTRRGALPEILTPDVGALCTTLEEMLAAAETVASRDPVACRTRAERHFTHLQMAEQYVRAYQGLLATGTLPPGLPATD